MFLHYLAITTGLICPYPEIGYDGIHSIIDMQGYWVMADPHCLSLKRCYGICVLQNDVCILDSNAHPNDIEACKIALNAGLNVTPVVIQSVETPEPVVIQSVETPEPTEDCIDEPVVIQSVETSEPVVIQSVETPEPTEDCIDEPVVIKSVETPEPTEDCIDEPVVIQSVETPEPTNAPYMGLPEIC